MPRPSLLIRAKWHRYRSEGSHDGVLRAGMQGHTHRSSLVGLSFREGLGMAELSSWPYTSPRNLRWERDVPEDCKKWPFRVGLRRGVLRRFESLPYELDELTLVQRALGSVVDMRAAGPTLLHSWIQIRRADGDSWDTIGQMLGVKRQTAQERFGRRLTSYRMSRRAADELWVSVQVARDRAVSAAIASEIEMDWDGWRPREARGGPTYRRKLPDGSWPLARDQHDIAVLCRVLGSIEEELAWLVAEARARGVTWESLSGVFGVRGRQAVERRFGKPVGVILENAAYAADRRYQFVTRNGYEPEIDRPFINLPEKGLCL